MNKDGTYIQKFDILQTENIELAVRVKDPEVLIVVHAPPLPPHSVNLLCYVHYRGINPLFA